MNKKTTVAHALVEILAKLGVRRIYGVPGGGSSLDLIRAAEDNDIQFILTKSENSAVMMAGAIAEITGIPGVALMTKGPGMSNAANGVAYARLDRAPVIIITDGFSENQLKYITHQVFDQKAFFAPITKGHTRLESINPVCEINKIIQLACTPPMGPVHVELTGEVARQFISSSEIPISPENSFIPDTINLKNIISIINSSKKPILIIGLEARQYSEQVQKLADLLKCPVLQTYKAKGVISDFHPQAIGIFTGGSQEAESISRSDLMIMVGLDPVEMILQPWSYNKSAIELSNSNHLTHYILPKAKISRDLGRHLTELNKNLAAYSSLWVIGEIIKIRTDTLKRLIYPSIQFGVAPDRIVQISAKLYLDNKFRPRMTVDAGAHMFSATTFFPITRAGDVLISNGLATMAFALPAAIAAAIEDPSTPVICFTGDGGLMMCLGELCTAVEQSAHIIVVVFNDSSLSLIDIKQQSRKLPSNGVRWSKHDFAETMNALGGKGMHANTEEQYIDALQYALKNNSPFLIDVQIDPSGYSTQLKAMRG